MIENCRIKNGNIIGKIKLFFININVICLWKSDFHHFFRLGEIFENKSSWICKSSSRGGWKRERSACLCVWEREDKRVCCERDSKRKSRRHAMNVFRFKAKPPFPVNEGAWLEAVPYSFFNPFFFSPFALLVLTHPLRTWRCTTCKRQRSLSTLTNPTHTHIHTYTNHFPYHNLNSKEISLSGIY